MDRQPSYQAIAANFIIRAEQEQLVQRLELQRLVQEQQLVLEQEQLRCERHRCQQWCCCSYRKLELVHNRSSCERRGEPSSEPTNPSSS